MEKQSFNVYKGLQKPLVFKGFKGRFIYFGVSSVLIGLVAGAIVGTVVNGILGAVTMLGCIVIGYALTASQQKKGLYRKKRSKGIYVVPNNWEHHGKQKGFR